MWRDHWAGTSRATPSPSITDGRPLAGGWRRPPRLCRTSGHRPRGAHGAPPIRAARPGLPRARRPDAASIRRLLHPSSPCTIRHRRRDCQGSWAAAEQLIPDRLAAPTRGETPHGGETPAARSPVRFILIPMADHLDAVPGRLRQRARKGILGKKKKTTGHRIEKNGRGAFFGRTRWISVT